MEAADDGDWWFVDGYKTMSFLGIQTGDRFDGDPDQLRTSATFAEVRPAAYDPVTYIDENEPDGVWGSVMYPSQGLVLFPVPVSDVVTAAMRAYNDWLADFCRGNTARLKGVAMVNVDDIDDAVGELAAVPRARARRRADHRRTAAVAAVPVARLRPLLGRRPGSRRCRLSLHVATDRADPTSRRTAAFRLDVKHVPPSVFVNPDCAGPPGPRRPHLLRRVRAIPAASASGRSSTSWAWIPFFLDRLDYTYTDRPRRGPEWLRFADPTCCRATSSGATCFASFQQDPQRVAPARRHR